MVIAHFMVGAQKKMVLGPAGWLRNARNEEVVAILFVIGSVCACLSFFLSKSVSGSRREKNEDKEREERFQSACDLFWCASRETRERLYSHYHELLIYIYIYIHTCIQVFQQRASKRSASFRRERFSSKRRLSSLLRLQIALLAFLVFLVSGVVHAPPV